jgi:ribonuclease HI
VQKVIIHTDGACQGNPGPGGWAATLAYGDHKREISGGAPATTNNRMELQAAIEGLDALKRPCEVEMYTDSTYLRSGVTAWIHGWKRNGWVTKTKVPVKNVDLWQALDRAATRHKVTWHWVKGHAGHDGNENCDRLATGEIDKLRKKLSSTQLKAALEEFRRRDNGASG